MHTCADAEPLTKSLPHQFHLELKSDLKPEKDGTWDEEEKFQVEINKSSPSEDNRETRIETVLTDRQIAERKVTSGDPKVTQNFDEIITEKREEKDTKLTTETEKKVQCKEKSFSLQRAWCCLTSRRTS